MKPKTIILMVVAVTCGLAASFMTSQLLAERETKEEAPKETVKVLVARRNLEIGLVIKDPKELFKEKTFLKGEEPAKALTDQDYDQLKDRRLVNQVKADAWVSQDDLLDKNQNSLSARLPKGMRAVGLKVNIENIAGGFASLPMSRVDIISVLRRGDGDSISQIILENILVLAADGEASRPNDKSALPANTVTVALTPEQAELVALAQEMGTLKLVLRSDGDTAIGKTHGVKGNRLLEWIQGGKSPEGEEKVAGSGEPGASALIHRIKEIQEKKEKPEVVVKEPVALAAPKPNWKTHVLTIYNGDQGTRYPFKLDKKGNLLNEDITRVEPTAKTPPAVAPSPQPEAKQPQAKQPPAEGGAGKVAK